MKKRKKRLSAAPLGGIRSVPIITDPQGCYTGRPLEQHEQPIQDADDL